MIRDFEDRDLEQASILYVEVFKHAPWNEGWKIEWVQDRLQMIMDSPGFFGCLYEEDKTVVGAIVGRTNSFKGRRELEIVELFVSPTHQSKGLGKKLLSAIEKSAKQGGYSHSTLITSRAAPAFDFYIKRGFKARSDMTFMSHSLD
ncbi:hypothetical protein NBRC116494_03820 [Aurantivibrio plasticivorans]